MNFQIVFKWIETIRLNRLRWFGHVQRMEGNWIPKRVLNMNLGTKSLRGRPRNRWQDEVREDGRIVGGEVWQEKVRNREEWKKLLRTARNCCILHMSMEWMNEWMEWIWLNFITQVLRSTPWWFLSEQPYVYYST